MANEFKVKKGLIVDGSNTVLDIQGTQGQLFSVTDSLTGDLFSVSDVSGVPILNVNSSGAVDVDGNINLGYADKINFGTSGSGLEIYSDSASNSYIKETGGSGALVFQSNEYYFQTNASYTTMQVTPNSGVVINAVSSVGLTINADTDNATESDVPFLSFKMDGTMERLRIGVDSSNNPYISTDSDGNLPLKILTGTNNSQCAIFNADNTTEFAGAITVSGDQSILLGGLYSKFGVYTDGGTYTNQWQKVLSVPYASNMFGFSGFTLDIHQVGSTDGKGAHATIYFNMKFQLNDGRVNANIINYNETKIDASHIAIRRDHANLKIELYHKVTTSYTRPYYFIYNNSTTPTWYNTVTGNDTALAATTDNGFTELNLKNGFSSDPTDASVGFYGDVEIHKSGNDTTGKLTIAGNNNTGTPGQKTSGTIEHRGAGLKTVITHNGSDVITIGTGTDTTFAGDVTVSGGDITVSNAITGVSGGSFRIKNNGGTTIATFADNLNTTFAGTITAAGGSADNNDTANILTLNASQHARLLVDTSSTSGHRATLALESNGNELTLGTTGSASYLDPVGELTISGQVIFPSAATTKPVLPNGFISRNDETDTSGRHDIWGISEKYYPSNSTAGDAWGIQWSGTPNDICFVGGGSDRFTVSLDEGNITGAGTATFAGNITTTGSTIKVDPASGDAMLVLEGAAGAQTLRFDQNSIRTTTNTDLNLFTNGNTNQLFLDQGTGNVGLGTTSPLGILSVRGTGDAIRVESENTGAGGAQVDLLHFTTSPADDDINGLINFGGYYSSTSSAYAASIRSVWPDVSERHGQLEFWTRDGTEFAQRLRINHDGNATFAGDVTISKAAPTLEISSTSGGTAQIIIGRTADTKARIKAGDQLAGDLTFSTGGVRRLMINSAGAAKFAGTLGVSGKDPVYGITLPQGSGGGNKIAWTDSTPTFAASIYANNTNDKLTFATKNASNAETVALEIDTSQSVAITGANVAVGGTAFDVQGSQGQLFSVTNSLTGDLFSVADVSGVPIFNVNSSGAVDVDGTFTSSGDIVAYSDERLKTDVQTLDGSKVYNMRGVSFTKDDKKSSGVIAQELEKIAPELVSNNSQFKAVAYGNLTGYLIEAIKELKAEIEELKKEIK